MKLSLAAALLAVAASSWAAKSPAEADFAEGYWDREFNYGRQTPNYNLSVAVEDVAKARRDAEAVLKAAGGKLTSFNDMTNTPIHEYGHSPMSSAMSRPAYSMAFQLEEPKAAKAANELILLGRLISFNSGVPYGVSQQKEIEERLEWIDKERQQNAEALKTMPVARAMLEAKQKRLKSYLDQSKSGKGVATVTVQIMRELPPQERGPALPR